jgi:hypothetical protein
LARVPTVPSYLVRGPDGSDAGAIFDLPHQRKVALQIEDEELARLLAESGIAPARPPLLDAPGHGVHGGHVPRPQRNWFLAPPLENVVAELESILAPSGYTLVPAHR